MLTETLAVDSTGDLAAATKKAADLLRAGEIVAVPTETVYGLAADATNPAAVAKVFAAKGRPTTDPLIVHISRRSQLDQVAAVPEEIAPHLEMLIEKLWPGPLTLILPKQPLIPDAVTAGLPTVAVRMPENRIMRAVLRSAEVPLAAPSANRFGGISPTTAAAVQAELDGQIPLILDGGACSFGVESTIARVLPPEKEGGKPVLEILRPGPLTKDDLKPLAKVKYSFRTVAAGESAEAPGQLERHYAPNTPLRLLDEVGQWTPESGKKVGLLVLDDASDWTARGEIAVVQALSPGSAKLPEAMVRFYHCLRSLDAAGLDEIIVQRLPERGLGVTLNERLSRAATPATVTATTPAAELGRDGNSAGASSPTT